MIVVQATSLLLVAALATLVVLTDDPRRQVLPTSLLGLALGGLFFALKAPDVALSQIAVGTVALPAMLVLAIAKVRSREQAGGEADRSGGGAR